jgi:hypothetical protein
MARLLYMLTRFLALTFFVGCAIGMMAKNRKNYDPSHMDAEERLRANMCDLYSQNLLSGKRAQELMDDAYSAGNDNFRELVSRSVRATGKRNTTGHEARDLRQKMLKSSQWPGAYWCEVRCMHKRKKNATKQWVAIWLPHELLDCIADHSIADKMLERDGLDPSSLFHLQECESKAGQTFATVGLWGDGVPVNWDRSESIETLAISFPGQTGANRNVRIPLVGMSKKQCCDETWEDIFDVLQWSFGHCANGTWPAERHDGQNWHKKTDRHRAKQVGRQLAVKAVLVEVRGDWEFVARVFGFPRWNTKRGCCWRCKTTPSEVNSFLFCHHLLD